MTATTSISRAQIDKIMSALEASLSLASKTLGSDDFIIDQTARRVDDMCQDALDYLNKVYDDYPL